MTPEQHKQYTAACSSFGDALAKIFTTEAPTMERQSYMDYDGNWTSAGCPEVKISKDWEIMEYKTTQKHAEPGVIINLNGVTAGLLYHWDIAFKHGIVSIHTVRRLSDNTVWTVGDKVCFTHEITKGWERNPEHYIKYFHKGDSKLMYACCDSHVPVCGPVANTSGAYKSGHFLLCQLNKCEQNRITLFTTADGVELFEGDKAYALINGTIFEWDAESANRPSFPHISYSTPEAAKKAYEDWLNAQPVICMDDIKDRCHLSALELAELETLSKSK